MLLKSGINRVGGKAYLSQWLCSFLPEHTLYCEPFAGGAKLLFAKEPSPVEILNDADNELVNLYRIIQKHIDPHAYPSLPHIENIDMLQTDSIPLPIRC